MFWRPCFLNQINGLKGQPLLRTINGTNIAELINDMSENSVLENSRLFIKIGEMLTQPAILKVYEVTMWI
jgi:hypothetical protein